MTRKIDKQKVIELRLKGYSYSQIKNEIKVSKSTLSDWLKDMPLSDKRIRELRDWNPRKIENYRSTMQKKREMYLEDAYKKTSKEIGVLSKRDLFIAGLFLYWGEGSKTKDYSIALTNTNPSMLIFFIKWLKFFSVPKSKLRANLHLYSDMNIKKQILFWSKSLGIPISQFRKSYIKKTKLSSITYRNAFKQGTCTVTVEDKKIATKVLMGLKYVQDFVKK